jgi:hypothetical protein
MMIGEDTSLDILKVALAVVGCSVGMLIDRWV